jgi:signal transduction histidine kinase
VVYVSILAVILLLSSGSIYSTFSTRLDHRFPRFRLGGIPVMSDDGIPTGPAEVRAELIDSLLMVNGALLAIAGVLSYWLAGVTLEPIQAAYNRQRRFLGDASHELRTPLAILQADLENERDASSITEKERAQVESHLEEVMRMSRIVSDLLTLSRLDESDGITQTPTVLSLVELTEEAVQRLRSIAKREGITMEYASAMNQEVRVLAHKELLMQALSNVIKNAIVYNKKGGTVKVSLAKEGEQAMVRVEDTGIGIAEQDLKKIGSRFYRGDESRSRQTGGSGLGLAIVRSIMKQSRGSLQVESALGKGTIVTMRIPAIKAS